MICIIIGGASASGKTFLSEELLKELEKNNISSQLISMDNYFHEIPDNIDLDLFRKTTNFDTPTMLNLHQLSQDLITLNNGHSFNQKTFEFKTNRYKTNEQGEYIHDEIHPSEVIIIEGIFAQYFANTFLSSELATISINIATSNYADIIKTRIQRDTITRGFNKEQVLKNEHKFVGPGFYQYTAKHTPGSDVYVLNDHENKDEEPISFASILQQIMEAVREKQQAVALNQLPPRKKAPNAIEMARESQRLANIAEKSTSPLIHKPSEPNISMQQTIQNRIERSKKIGQFFKLPLYREHQDEQGKNAQITY